MDPSHRIIFAHIRAYDDLNLETILSNFLGTGSSKRYWDKRHLLFLYVLIYCCKLSIVPLLTCLNSYECRRNLVPKAPGICLWYNGERR